MTELDELSKKIEAAKQVREDSPENLKRKVEEADNARSIGMKVAIEIFAGIAVGVIIGYSLDSLFNTLPLFLVIFMVVGAAAGFWNVYKSIAKEMDHK